MSTAAIETSSTCPVISTSVALDGLGGDWLGDSSIATEHAAYITWNLPSGNYLHVNVQYGVTAYHVEHGELTESDWLECLSEGGGDGIRYCVDTGEQWIETTDLDGLHDIDDRIAYDTTPYDYDTLAEAEAAAREMALNHSWEHYCPENWDKQPRLV